MKKEVIIIVVALFALYLYANLSKFNNTIYGGPINEDTPRRIIDTNPMIPPADIPEEEGFPLYGSGIGMSDKDSQSFVGSNELLTDYKNPESYGESSLNDPFGTEGAIAGSRIIKIKNVGSQTNFKPMDESQRSFKAGAYNSPEVQSGKALLNENTRMVYTDSYIPSNNLNLETSPGHDTTGTCESMLPRNVKYGDHCITVGDIPYGEIVNGMVNPRLVDRSQFFMGDYDPKQVLAPDNGLLYPTLGKVN
jgi:hypothetical protein